MMKRNQLLEKKLKHLAIDQGGNFVTLARVLGVTSRTIQNVIYGKCSESLADKIKTVSGGAISTREARWNYKKNNKRKVK